MTGDAPSASRGLLLLLAAANFIIGMGAFVVIGVLTPVAGAFGVDAATAAWMLTGYALVYAVASPLLVATTGALDRKRVLLSGLSVFLAGALLCAAAPDFRVLLAGRVLMALGAGVATPVCASIAAALSPPEARGRALATVFGGLTLAQVAGVPVGAWLGYAAGWQAAFLAVAALTAAGLALLAARIPAGLVTPVASLASLGEALRRPDLTAAVAFTAVFVGGLYAVYTFLAPLLETRFLLDRDGVTAMLALFGLGAVIGNALGGWMTDRVGPVRTLVALCAAQMALMPVFTLVPLGLWITAGLMLVWSVCAWSFMAAQQTRLAALDMRLTPVLFALNAAAIYVGGSVGSWAGGQAFRAAGLTPLGLVGAALVAAALLSLWLAGALARSRSAAG